MYILTYNKNIQLMILRIFPSYKLSNYHTLIQGVIEFIELTEMGDR